MQTFLVYLVLAIAVGFLVKKYLLKPKKKGNCDKDCKC